MKQLLRATRRRLPLALEMAPLIDILLLLLVFVLLTSVFGLPQSFIDLPVASSGAEGSGAVVVTIQEDGQILFRGRPVGISALERELQASLAEAPARRVNIHAFRATALQQVIEVVEACDAAGVEETNIAVAAPRG